MVDSHCHLADEAFAADLADVALRAQAAGVAGALCILAADEAAELDRAAAVRAAWPAVAFAAGVHPHRAGHYTGRADQAVEIARHAVASVGALAVGEIGLDYHYDFAPRPVQQQVFAGQVALARELGLPVVIHTRLAFADTLAVIREAGSGVRGVMHCFSGTADEAAASLDAGFYLSLSGIVTFPKAGDLRDVARTIPRDRLLVETDAPYLAPVPFRGRRNEPAWVARTLEVLASVRGETPAALAAQVAANFAQVFGESRAGR